MNERKDDDVRDLLAAWALDAVDDVERARVERAVAEDPALADEARALRETAARLAQGSATPAPAHVRDAVLGALTRVPQTGPATGAGTVGEPPRADEPARPRPARGAPRAPSVRWLAVAAALVVGAAVPAGVAYQQHERARQAEQRVEVISGALNEPGAQLVRSGVTGGGQAVAVVAADGRGVVTTSDLPRLRDHDYQLWVVDAAGATSAGVLGASGGTLTAEVDDVPPGGSLAITVEPSGGSQQPTTTPIVVLTTT